MPLIGDVLTSKDKETGQEKIGSYYLKVKLNEGETLVLRNGDIIDLRTSDVYFAGLVEAGMISEETRAERAAKVPAFVKLKASVRKDKITGTAAVSNKAAF